MKKSKKISSKKMKQLKKMISKVVREEIEKSESKPFVFNRNTSLKVPLKSLN